MKLIKIITPLAFLCGLQSAQALTITPDFSKLGTLYQDASGQLFDTQGTGRADVTSGFELVVNYAASVLAKAVGVKWSTSISFIVTDAKAVAVSFVSMIDSAGHPSSSSVLVDNLASKFFIDATPWDNSEFDIQSKSATLGGSEVNVSSIGNAVSPEAVGRYDLLTVVLHEMEHTIAYYSGLDGWRNLVSNGELTVSRASSGLQDDFLIPVTSGSHIDGNAAGGLFNDTVIADPGFGAGQRALLTGAEIYGACALAGCTPSQVNLNPYASVSAVPLPASAPMFGAALLTLGAIGYGMSRKKGAAAA